MIGNRGFMKMELSDKRIPNLLLSRLLTNPTSGFGLLTSKTECFESTKIPKKFNFLENMFLFTFLTLQAVMSFGQYTEVYFEDFERFDWPSLLCFLQILKPFLSLSQCSSRSKNRFVHWESSVYCFSTNRKTH